LIILTVWQISLITKIGAFVGFIFFRKQRRIKAESKLFKKYLSIKKKIIPLPNQMKKINKNIMNMMSLMCKSIYARDIIV